jgi:hypothetical protein
MKNLLALAIIVLGFSAASFGQVTATAITNATIITPIAITKTANLEFGNIAVNPTLGGTVVMPTSGVRTKTLGVTLPVSTGTPGQASFTVTGLAGSTFSFGLPTAFTILGPGDPMTVDAFTSSSTGTLSSGTEIVTVGATLHVAAAQLAGSYTNTTGLIITVNYN